jgi:hypothetical protein
MVSHPGAGFLTYEDPDDYTFYWAKEFWYGLNPAAFFGIF